MSKLLMHRGIQFGILLIAFFTLLLSSNLLPEWARLYPHALIIPFADWINASMIFLQDDFWTFIVVDEDDFEEETTAVMFASRSLSDSIQFAIDIFRNLLLGGNKGLGLPAIPWVALAAAAFIAGYALKGWRLSLLAGLSVIYLAIMGQWYESMRTLSLLFVAVPLSISIGLFFGIVAYKNKSFELTLAPLLNIAQSLPHFSYLIPVVVFFGIGDHAGAIATIVFATPPMIRLTLLGLKKVSPEVVEAGVMNGCNNKQLLFKVLIPSARHDIMIGVNQVIMSCLAMVVIASFIGASGLGYSLLVMLNGLKIGKAFEFGVSIVLIAIVLDRLSLAWAEHQRDYLANLPFHKRYRFWIYLLTALIVSIVLSSFFPILYLVPEELALTTAPFWDAIVDWIITNWSDTLQVFRTFMLVEILIPMRNAFIAIPTVALLLLVSGVGYLLGGIRSAIIVFLFIAFIAVTGWWEKAMITLYMTTFSVIASVIIGLNVGIWASRKTGRAKFMLLICDTFQTFPSFIYLIPVIMLFQVNDVSVITAVIIYATIPVTRYTIEGLMSVPQSLQEAATMSGVNKIQRLLGVELPIAFPHIMIGVNQTVLFALFMVIIGAFIGTQDLGQVIMQSLSESNMGKGLVLGLCVAFIGLTIDHLINQWAVKRKRELGIS